MTTYTTQPSKQWTGYVDILRNGQIQVSTPPEKVEETIAFLANSTRRHFQAIADRLERNDARLVIASGCAYSVGSSSDNPKGFGGAKWEIAFFDGRTATTDSLWCLGDIPAEWRFRLSDNATLKEVR
jgi:hypothetical protein